MRTRFLLCLLLCACDDEPAVEPAADALPADARIDGALADATRDAAPADAAPADAAPLVDLALPPDTALDAQPPADSAVEDAAPPDMAPDVALPPPVEAVLALQPEVGAFGLLDPGQSLRFAVALPPELAALEQLALVVEARIWRFEDGEVELDVGAGPQPALLPGDGRALPVILRLPVAGEVAGPDGDFPVFPIASAGLRTITLTARGGTLEVLGATLTDVRRPLPPPFPPEDQLQGVELRVMPCGEGCDDGAALSAAIAAADAAQPLIVRLAAGRYLLRTPVLVRRSAVRLVGEGPNVLLFWDPEAEGPRGAVQFIGRGRSGPGLPIDATESGRRRFALAQPWVGTHARITADDFGPVPTVCANGRDQERRQRHLGQLVRVLNADGAEIELDRPLNLAVPVEANARLEPVELLVDVGVTDLRFEANCPDSLINERFTTPVCPNAFVQGDAAVLFEWVAGARVQRVEARGFGKFSLELSNTLDSLVDQYHMDHPSEYGDGGFGYGVHLITASRTVVHDTEVVHARHGVVVDFGSSDSQMLNGRYLDMTQALVDVHGEASRDTLIRGNTFADSQLAVIVGGGGGFAHCNDGPRHHILHNTMEGITNSGITVFFESRQVFVRHNRITGALFGLTVALDAGEVLAERNVFAQARVPVQVAGAGPVWVRGNVFADVCTPEMAAMALNGVIEVAEDNVYCP